MHSLSFSRNSALSGKSVLIATLVLFVFMIISINSAEQEDSSSSSGTTATTEQSMLNDNGEGIQGRIKTKMMASKVFSDARSFDKYFIEGKVAYYDQLWYACAFKLEKALTLYKEYKKVVTNCRLQCLKGQRKTKMSNYTISAESFAQFTYFLKTADCMRRCRQDELGDQKEVNSEYGLDFENRIPYQYLQFCYYKLEKYKEAAAATYTHYLSHPENADTKNNMRYFRDNLKLPVNNFVDLEMTPYREYYIRGTLAYADKDWKLVIEHLENSLKEYFLEDEKCKADCYDTGKINGVEFITGVADLVIKVMICQMECEEKLSKLYTEPVPDFLASIFHYLQYSYYQLERFEESAEMVASFLLLNPSHDVMEENKVMVKDKLKYSDEDFVPRESVEQYVAKKKEMFSNMDFINKNFKWGDISEEEGNLGEEILTESTNIPDDWMTRYEKLGMHIIAKAVDLHREQRFITDGLIKNEQCDELLILMKDVAVQTNGAQVFDLKIAKQTMMKNLGERYEASLRTLIRATEVVRHYAHRYNQPDTGYYLKKTSIVCWYQREDGTTTADCYPQEDGSCIKYNDMSEDFYKGLFTTVTYLNEVVDDGQFSFFGNQEHTDYTTGVKCGRTIGFNSGDRHYLKVPEDGAKRCAMFINHSVDKKDDEPEYKETIALLHRLDELRLEKSLKSSKEVMKRFEDKGVKIVKTGKELKGEERFVADGMSSETQCSDLMNMVLSDAIFGDGYTKDPDIGSPHTNHEQYRGITIYRATMMMHAGKIPVPSVKAFLELTENSRLLVERYFNLTKPLYFDFTHLVCRSAVNDSNTDREDLSHPVHADNCQLQPDGTCTKGFPAFTQRDYSAVLYLNDNFKGGEFFFAHSNTTEQVVLQPKCGRFVAFNGGEFHGVRAVTSGSRCALALWFTLNPNFKELAHIHARQVLREMEERKPMPREEL